MRTAVLSFLSVFIAAGFLHAQSGVLRGMVYDESGLGMPGAAVFVQEISRGAYTDSRGSFAITGVPEGTYTCRIEYIGYEKFEQKVEIGAGSGAELKAFLKPGVVLGSEVLVLGDRLKGQAKALNQQRANTNITNIVSADQIGRFPDANIGDAMKRIPGITVINDQGEARFGLIRGTEPRFNSVTLNGERLPSAESGSRTVQLDLIPSDMIQTIEVSKALTPDMDADAIGGSANLVTRAAPPGLRFSGTLGSGYNFLSQQPMGIANFVAGKRLAGGKLGVIFGGSWFNHNFGSDNAEFEWDRTASGTPFLNVAEIRKYDVQRIRRSGSLSMDYRLGNNSTLFFRSLYNVRDDFENRFRVVYSGMSAPDANGLTRGRVEAELKGGGEDQKFRRLERQTVTSNTLSGQHLLNGKINLDWAATFSYAQEDRPNERYISWRSANLPLTSGLRPNTTNPEFPFVSTQPAFDISAQPFRRFQLRNDFTDETDANGRFNLRIPLGDERKVSQLKLGGVIRTKAKVVEQNRGLLVPASGQTVRFNDFTVNNYTDAGFLANGGGVSYNVGRFPIPESLEGFEKKYNAAFQEDNIGNREASFDGTEQILGTYAMLTQQLGNKFTVIGGLRVERTGVTYNATQFDADDNATDVSGSSNYTNVMPALHLKLDFSPNTLLRAAWTNTLARPDYVDLAPSRRIDVSDNTLVTGNPNLKATTASNLDLMFEHYFSTVGIFSAGIFYKDIKDFIYATSVQNFKDPISGNTFIRATTPTNGPSATVTGFEAAIQRQLDFLPGFLKNLGIYLNYTFTDSDAEVLFFDEDEGNVVSFETGLPGASKHNFNGSFAYEGKRLQARVSLNYHSGFLDPDDTFLALSTAKTVDSRFLDAQLHVDANASFAFSPKWRLFVDANNLTNQPLRYYQGVSGRTMQAEYYNARVQFGLKLDFFRNDD
ncbi:MAG: TonB-dependent receptor [Saprospiraceae bacterium]